MTVTDGLLVIVLFVTMAGLLLQVRRRPSVSPPEAVSAAQPPSEVGAELVVRSGGRDEGRAEVSLVGMDQPVFVVQAATVPQRSLPAAGLFVQDTIYALLQRSPALLRQLRSAAQVGLRSSASGPMPTSYVVTFPKAAQQALAKGNARLMASGSRTLPTVVSTRSGKIMAQATIVPRALTAAGGATAVGGGGATALGGATAVPLLPVVVIGAVGAVAVAVMTRRLEDAIEQVESRVLAILDRMQDDDYGRLEAALRTAGAVAALVQAGDAIPDHDRQRLAIAARDADATYLARHRLLERFQDEYERVYAEHQARGRDVAALPKEIREILTEPEHFGKETAIYVAALVTRAKVQTAVAGLLARDGHGELALSRLQVLAAELDDDARDFARRMHTLADAEASRGKDQAIIGMAKQVSTMLDLAVAELPPRELVDVTLRLELPAGLLGLETA